MNNDTNPTAPDDTHSDPGDDPRTGTPDAQALPADVAQVLEEAARRVRRGFLDTEQRATLATLLHVAGHVTLPTPVTAALFAAITALTRTPHDLPVTDQATPHHHNDDHGGGGDGGGGGDRDGKEVTPPPGRRLDNCTVGIDDERFPAHDNGARWNGFVCPAFRREIAEQVTAHMNRVNATGPSPEDQEYFLWVGDLIVHLHGPYLRDPDYRPVLVEPDAWGRYPIGAMAWAWRRTDEPDHP